MLPISSFSDSCNNIEIVFNEEVIPRDGILNEYSKFLLSNNNDICLTLYAGNYYFDLILIIYSVLFCLYIDNTTADDVVNLLTEGDYITYKNDKAVFGKIDEKGYAVIFQAHNLKVRVPKVNFYAIKPYNGNSKSLERKGLKPNNFAERSRFISSVFNNNEINISSVNQKSIIILTNRITADLFMQGLSIKCGENHIKLTRLVTASYFTEEEEYRYSGNSSKNNAVLKFMHSSSLAREMIIEDKKNDIIGIIVLGKDLFDKSKSELTSILERKSLQLKYINYSIELDDLKGLTTIFENVKLFACTSEAFQQFKIPNKSNSKLNEGFRLKGLAALNKKIIPQIISTDKTWDVINTKNILFSLMNNSGEEGLEQFVISALSLIKLFSTAIFPIKFLENEIENRFILIQSPQKILSLLEEYPAKFTGVIAEKMNYIIRSLKNIYLDEYETNQKFEYILSAFKHFSIRKKWAIVIPKAYYKEVFKKLLESKTTIAYDYYIETAAKFDISKNFDEIIVVEPFQEGKFNLFKSLSSKLFTVLQYEFQNQLYILKSKEYKKLEKIYNEKMFGRKPYTEQVDESDENLSRQEEVEISFEEFEKSISFKNIINNISNISSKDNDIAQAEICKIARCVNGETIFFTKYFIPYIADYNNSTAFESEVVNLEVGDAIIFTKNNSQSKDIVDEILLDLISNKKEDDNILFQQYTYSKHWKEVLKGYMVDHDLSYKDISAEMGLNGIHKHEVTLRTWLNEDSHIVGPRDIESFYQIALICNEKDMLDDPEKYFEACKYIRKIRIKILKSLGKAIVKNYMGTDGSDEFYEYIAQRINDISQVVQIETIIDVNDLSIPAYLANKPHYVEVGV